MINPRIKTYSDLIQITDYKKRFEYLKLNGIVGNDTFGCDRYLNQQLYTSERWKKLRREIIIRDNGCDMAMEGYEIRGRILIHHIEPITVEDILQEKKKVFDPENLVCVSHNTHNAVHYSDDIFYELTIRSPHDTCPWKL